MTDRIQIIDNVFSEEILNEILQFAQSDVTPEQYSLKELDKDIVPAGIQYLFDYASKIDDLTTTKYLEFWKHQNASPSWHFDCDEIWLQQTGEYSFALNTIIFYPEIVGLKGGDLLTEDIKITPKTNRMVILPAGVWHKVEDINGGSRLSLNINPWHYRIETIGDSHI